MGLVLGTATASHKPHHLEAILTHQLSPARRSMVVETPCVQLSHVHVRQHRSRRPSELQPDIESYKPGWVMSPHTGGAVRYSNGIFDAGFHAEPDDTA